MVAEDGPAGAGQDGGSTEDECLWTLFRGLVDSHGRTRAAHVLGVNYRTVVANLEAGRLSRRMRSAAQAYQESGAEQPEETGRRVAGPEESVGEECPPPRRAHGLPDAGVVTLVSQPDEERAFGSGVLAN